MISKNTLIATIVAAVLLISGVAVYASMGDTSGTDQHIYNSSEECSVSVCYDSGDGNVNETRVKGYNIKDILIDGMEDMGFGLIFDNDGSINSVDGKKADEGKVWVIWKWDTDWKVISSIYESGKVIDLKDNSAFGISMAKRFTTNPQGYTNPGFYVNVKIGNTDESVRVFSTTPKTIFIEAMKGAGHTVSEADGKITVDGTELTGTDGYVMLYQRTEFKITKDPITGEYTRDLVRDDKWEKVSLSDDKFFMRDRANFAIVPIVNGEYDEPNHMADETIYKPKGDFYVFLQISEDFIDLVDFENNAPGLTRNDLVGGIWVHTIASTADKALEKIFGEMGWDFVASEAIVGGNDLRGWIFYFFGLYSNGIYHSADESWDYPAQFNWNSEKEEWEFNQWTSGYYSYVSNPYFAVVYCNTPNNSSWVGPSDLTPEDAENLWATV